ncbi:MAG: hypothetical protein V4689_17315 [Verrucomicrobiota bacterium]
MHHLLPALLLAVPAISLAEEAPVAAKKKGWENIFTLLPPGSELKEVMLPRYDKDHQLTSVLKAQVMRLVNTQQIEGTTVAIEFFKPDNSPQGRIDLTTALIDKEKNLLSTKEPVKIRTDEGTADGTGVYYDFKLGKGVLLGPATTVFHLPPKETAMNPPDSPFRAMALVGMSLMTQSLLAAPPPPITDAELAAIQADATSRAPAAEAAATKTLATLKTDLADASAASQAAATFLVQNDLPAITPDAAPADAKPLDVKPGPDDTVISCDGAIYFDPEERVLVYLKNVIVKNPQFNATGRIDELKVFFAEKPVEEKDKVEDEKDKSGFGAGIGKSVGKAERVIATGAIVIDAKPKPGEDAVQASGAIFTYNLKSEEATLSGGFPWVRQGPKFLRAKKHDNLLRIYPKQNRFDTPGGGWEMGAPMDEINKDKKDKPNR